MIKNKLLCFLVAVFGVLFLVLKPGNSLRCYECNSHTHKACLEKQPPQNFSRECDQKSDKNSYIACRKIVQTIDFEVNGLPPDHRVIRSCAYQRQEINKCYQRSGFGGRQEVCACDTNDCNSSNMIKFNYGLLFATNSVIAYVLKVLVHS